MRVTIAGVLCLVGGLSGLGASELSAGEGDRLLTLKGLEPVSIGMTFAEAEKALGTALRPMDPKNDTEDCWFTSRADGVESWLNYLVMYGRIVRIDVWGNVPGVGRALPPVVTAQGIGIGSSVAEIVQQYGSALVTTSDPYTGRPEDGLSMRIMSADRDRGIILDTYQTKVGSMSTGTAEAIEIFDGCG